MPYVTEVRKGMKLSDYVVLRQSHWDHLNEQAGRTF